MRRYYLALAVLFLLTTQAVFSQTQQGYVRTLGRPDRKGEALSDVTIRAKGEHNFVNTNEDGIFSMTLPGKKNGEAYSLQQVQKTGYELNEADFIGRQLAFSDKVPLTIVMVSTDQLQADKLRIENNAYITAEKNFKAKIEQLEKQRDENRMTIEQYQEGILDIQGKFEKYQSLIEGLAEHYAHTDYDLLSEKDREINICIETGELERADSLIRLLFDPIDVLERNKGALSRLEQQIDEASQLLDQANNDMAIVLKQQEKDAEYLYQLYTIALARFDNEIAMHYIETRAELDTTNPSWQFDAGYCFQKYNDFVQAKKFYSRALESYRSLAKDNPNAYEPDLASTLNNLAVIYKNTQHLKESETLYLEALESYRRLAKDKPKYKPLYPSRDKSKDKSKDYEPDVARTLNNLALLYFDTQRFSESETMYLEALETRRRLAEKDPDTYEPGLAMTLNNLALLYSNTQRFTQSETLQLEALEIQRSLAKSAPKAYEPELAMTLNNLAVLYSNTQRISESMKVHLEVLEIYRRLAEDNPQTYGPVLGTTLNNLANLYDNTQRFTESEPIRLEALAIFRRLATSAPRIYEPVLAMTLNNLAVLYKNTQRLAESETLFLEALEIFKSLEKDTPDTHDLEFAKALNELADLYYSAKRSEESETLYLEALEIFRRLEKESPQTCNHDLVATLSSLAFMYYKTQRFPESEAMYLDAIDIYRSLAENDSQVFEPRLTNSLYSLGLLYWQQEQRSQAIPVFEEALVHYKSLVLHNPSYKRWYENTVQLLIQLYQAQSSQCLYAGQLEKAEQYARETLSIDTTQLNANTNLAAALLFQGKFDEAEVIYRRYKDELKESFSQSLIDCESAGIIPEERKADVEMIRKLLLE